MSDGFSLIAQAGGALYSALSPLALVDSHPKVEILPWIQLLESRTVLDQEVRIKSRATIELEAVILCSSWARQLPSCPGEAIIAPLDLGVGWGRMSDPITRSFCKIQQAYDDNGGRWMQYSAENKLQLNFTTKNSAHFHMVFPPKFIIPESLPKRGTPIYIKGRLVDLEWPDHTWETDLELGNEKCETLYVERMIVNI